MTEYSKSSIAKSSKLDLRPKGGHAQSLSWSDFDQLQKLELQSRDGQPSVSFLQGAPPSQSNPLALTGWRDKSNHSKDTWDKTDKHLDVSVASAILCIIANLETLASKKTAKEGRMALVKCKGAVDNLINNLDEQKIGAGAKIGKQNDQAVKELKVVKKILEKPKVDDLKPGPSTAKETLQWSHEIVRTLFFDSPTAADRRHCLELFTRHGVTVSADYSGKQSVEWCLLWLAAASRVAGLALPDQPFAFYRACDNNSVSQRVIRQNNMSKHIFDDLYNRDSSRGLDDIRQQKLHQTHTVRSVRYIVQRKKRNTQHTSKQTEV